MTAPKLAFPFNSGAAWLDFVATRGYRFTDAPVERVPTPARLDEWLRAAGLAPLRPPTDTDLADAVDLRETLHALAQAATGGDVAGPEAAATLNRWLARGTPALVPGAGGRPRWPAPADTGEALGLLAGQAAHALAGPGGPPLRACGDPQCRRVYLDPTGRRRWCSPERCGSKARVREFRRRHATPPPGA